MLLASIFWSNAFAQEYDITILASFPKYNLYPQDKGLFGGDRNVKTFSYDKRTSLAWVYSNEFMAQVQLPESFNSVMKEHKVQDMEKKKADVFTKKVSDIKRNIDHHYYVIDSINYVIDSINKARAKFVADSIARVSFVKDSLQKRQAFIVDSVRNLTEDTLAVNYPYPFSFRFILGKTNGSTEVGTKMSNSEYSKFEGETIYLNNRILQIGDYYKKVIPKSFSYGTDQIKEYYKAYALGHEFYVDKNDVILTPDYQNKLDSLLKTEPITRAHFNNLTKNVYKFSFAKIEMDNYRKFLNQYNKYPIAVADWSWESASEYSDFQNVNIDFYNPTKKTIKYVYVTFRATNAVGDPVSGATKTLTGIGPIKPGYTVSYNFEDVWYSDIIEKVSIVSVKVLYTDKSTRVLSPVTPAIFSDEEKEYMDNFNADLEALGKLSE